MKAVKHLADRKLKFAAFTQKTLRLKVNGRCLLKTPLYLRVLLQLQR